LLRRADTGFLVVVAEVLVTHFIIQGTRKMAQEVKIDPDGSSHFEGGEESTMPPVEETTDGNEGVFDEETVEELVKGTDPAIYLLLAVILIGLFYFLYLRRSKEESEDDFFSNLDGEKVCIQESLHAEDPGRRFHGSCVRRITYLNLTSFPFCLPLWK
jgi:hypothetical protein